MILETKLCIGAIGEQFYLHYPNFIKRPESTCKFLTSCGECQWNFCGDLILELVTVFNLSLCICHTSLSHPSIWALWDPPCFFVFLLWVWLFIIHQLKGLVRGQAGQHGSWNTCGRSNALCYSWPGCAVALSGMPITRHLVLVVSFFSFIHCSSSLSPLPSNHGYIKE